MQMLLFKTGGWFVVALLALVAAVSAVDMGFAVHMTIFAIAALLTMLAGIRTANYPALARGQIKSTDQSLYYDDVVRWGVIATTFWGLAGFLVGLFIAL